MFEFLSEQGKRVWSFLSAGVARGLSGLRVLKTLREYGLGYRTETFYSDWNKMKEAYEKSLNLRYVPKGKIPSENLYFPARVWTREPLQTTFRVDTLNLNTGEREYKYITIAHDVYKPIAMLEEEVKKVLTEYVEEYREYEIISAIPVWGRRRSY